MQCFKTDTWSLASNSKDVLVHIFYVLLHLLQSLLNVQLMVKQMLQCCAQLHIQALYLCFTIPAERSCTHKYAEQDSA